MIYLASPYTDKNPEIQEYRFQAVCYAARRLLTKGIKIFSPVAHSHPISRYGLPGNWEFWEGWDKEFIDACQEIWVLCLDGYKESKGIKGEVEYAKATGKRIVYLDAVTLEPISQESP